MKKVSIFILTLSLFSSCVSKKIYTELEDKYANLRKEHRQLAKESQTCLDEKVALEADLDQLKKAYDKAVADRDQLTTELASTKSNFNNLKNAYDALEKNSSAAIAKNVNQNKALLAQLEAKEKALLAENERLQNLEKKLQAGSKRVTELENVIAAKDAAMTKLKNAISKALTNFEGKGLTVVQKNGKVYISMENKLLFESGSWFIGKEGRKAVEQLGSVLGENEDISILIEGHTDNVPYKGSTQISGNWDLSTKRATAIVNILRENKNINPENLTAAGRGEFAPIASNKTAEGRAKNRRIEVILTPKLDEISKLLNEL